jgi:hypothetical protein
MLGLLLFCGCGSQKKAYLIGPRPGSDLYGARVARAIAAGRKMRQLATFPLKKGMPPALAALPNIGSPHPKTPGAAEDVLGHSIDQAAGAQARDRQLGVLAEEAAKGIQVSEGAAWRQEPEFGSRSEAELQESLKIVSLRAKAAILKGILDEVLYGAPEGTQNELDSVEKQLAEAVVPSPAPVAAQSPEQAGAAQTSKQQAVEARALAEASQHRATVTGALRIRPLQLRSTPEATDLEARFSALRHHLAQISADVERAAERVRR